MADLLGSILSSMDKPPTIGDAEKKKTKERQVALEKQKAAEKKKINAFRTKIEAEINSFINDSNRSRHRFDEMDKVCRSIIHDVTEVAGLTSFSFGPSDDCRYVILFKKEFAPSDEELLAYRNGELDKIDPEEARKRYPKKMPGSEDEAMSHDTKLEMPKEVIPASDYREKYKRLIGTESAEKAAKTIVQNKQFGNVPIENKRDKRSVEEVMNDVRAKKKKMAAELEHQSFACSTSGVNTIQPE